MIPLIVYGGTFDPPTYGHAIALSIALEHASKVVIVPCGIRSDKSVSSQSQDRIKLLELWMKELFADVSDRIQLDLEDIMKGRTNCTFDLMSLYYPEAYFLIGSDLIDEIKKWRHAEKLIQTVNFAIIRRLGIAINKNQIPLNNYVLLTDNEEEKKLNVNNIDEITLSSCSSTTVRNIARNIHKNPETFMTKTIALLQCIPPSVKDYILDTKLYQD